MKRVLLSILVILISICLFASYSYEADTLRVKGYVAHILQVTLDIDSSALPFNMISDEVQPSDTLESSPGLNIGTWTLFSDYSNVSATFTLTPLTYDGQSFNYYMQFTYPASYANGTYTYSLFPVLSDSTGYSIAFSDFGEGFVNIDQGNIYVRMVDDANTLVDCDKPGQYSSTLTIQVVAND